MKCMEPASAGKLRLRNRIAVAAMSRMQAEQDGTMSRDMAGYYARYARHGAGLVFTEALYTDLTSARAYFRQPGLATDEQAATSSSAGRRISRSSSRASLPVPTMKTCISFLRFAARAGLARGGYLF